MANLKIDVNRIKTSLGLLKAVEIVSNLRLINIMGHIFVRLIDIFTRIGFRHYKLQFDCGNF